MTIPFRPMFLDPCSTCQESLSVKAVVDQGPAEDKNAVSDESFSIFFFFAVPSYSWRTARNLSSVSWWLFCCTEAWKGLENEKTFRLSAEKFLRQKGGGKNFSLKADLEDLFFSCFFFIILCCVEWKITIFFLLFSLFNTHRSVLITSMVL